MKKVEREMIDQFNLKYDREAIHIPYKYSTYDGLDDDYVLEAKGRNKDYQTCLIEWKKLVSNESIAQVDGKTFIYLVSPIPYTTYFVFDISKLIDDDYKFGWHWRWLSKNTEFGKKKELELKFVGYVDKKDAVDTFKT